MLSRRQASRAALPGKRTSSLRAAEARDGYIMIAPWIAGFACFEAGPFLASFLLSLTKWDMLRSPQWVGLQNYRRLLTDDLVAIAAFNTVYYTFILVPLEIAILMAMALALNSNLRWIRVYRTLYYMPSITPAVANALLWMVILQPEFGLANFVLAKLGLPKQLWLLDPRLAKPSLIIMSLSLVGGSMPVMLAGLQGISTELYEAAHIDGANKISSFQYITVPLMTPVVFFVMVTSIIGSFQVFTAAFIATDGGPENATLFYVLLLYRSAFQYFRMGYSCSMAWTLFAVILGFTVLQFWLSRRWVYYEA